MGGKKEKKKRKTKARFREKHTSVRGLVSTILGGLALLLFARELYLVTAAGESLSLYQGALSLLTGLVSLVSLVLAVGAVREENSRRGFPLAGLFLSLLAAVCYGGCFYLGLK